MSLRMSVALCTYNGARFVGQQLESVVAQTRLPDELVVCDDGSQDETVRIVERFAAVAPFSIRLYTSGSTRGTTRNFERAVDLCNGEIIALCDQDDVWLPEKLARIEAEFASNSRIGLVFTDAEVVDEDLSPLGFRLWDKLGFDGEMRRLINTGRALDVLLPGWTVTGATMAFRASLKPLILEIPNDLQLIHDGWIALVVAAVSDVAILDQPLIKYRQHPGQQIGAPKGAAPGPQPSIRSLQDIRVAIAKANQYQDLIEIGGRLRQRLADRSGRFDCGAALGRLDARLKHLRARAELPENRFQRLGHVLRELLTLRYHSYSRGLFSAFKDLFA